MKKEMEKNWDRSDGVGASGTRPLPPFPLRPLSSGSCTEPGSTLSPSSPPWLGTMVRLTRAMATNAQSQALTLNSVAEDLGLCPRDLVPGLGRWGRTRKIRVKFGRVWCGGCVKCDATSLEFQEMFPTLQYHEESCFSVYTPSMVSHLFLNFVRRGPITNPKTWFWLEKSRKSWIRAVDWKEIKVYDMEFLRREVWILPTDSGILELDSRSPRHKLPKNTGKIRTRSQRTTPDTSCGISLVNHHLERIKFCQVNWVMYINQYNKKTVSKCVDFSSQLYCLKTTPLCYQ